MIVKIVLGVIYIGTIAWYAQRLDARNDAYLELNTVAYAPANLQMTTTEFL
jgi:hypothetical protein